MALSPCPDCQKEVSDTAPACPHCGAPIAAKKVGGVTPASAAPPQQGSSKKLVVAALLTVVLLPAAYFGYNWYRDHYAPPEFTNYRVDAKKDRADFGTIVILLTNESPGTLSDVSMNVTAHLSDGDNPGNAEEWPLWKPNERKEIRLRQRVDIGVQGGQVVQRATKATIQRLELQGLATKEGRRVSLKKTTAQIPIQD